MAQRPRRPDGKFAPGQPAPAHKHRRAKGVPNKFTRDIKEAMTLAGEMVGRDGAGRKA